ncbi:hypothetical protein P4483_23210 [Bacillus thuringiensis]|uniref:hypothetical protein n=1 Tax=Bacillus cereus group TaxID=86661 RepID=UPI000BEB5B7F|nr:MULTISPECIES: hypothetical protein [Bacillus cereus group]MCC6082063.1 hypothetical protein [Bacillus thuringiensis]MED3446811.1 hypothetical protein [Bacillus thuringiensis]PEB54487.1 hypothetical protein COM79_24980 [Bacillus cereus]PEB85646.1 hypothetical protein COM94_19070 [Bacillus thuringiensis]PGK93091.1 hypothetical protein CN911_21240 [Bacillus thuringiensis]
MLNTNKISDVVINWLEERTKKSIKQEDLLYGKLVTSLELLELLTYVELKLHLQVQLAHLPPSSVKTVGDLLVAIDKFSKIDLKRKWFLIKTKQELLDFRLWIEFQFERKVAVKLNSDGLMLGITVEEEEFDIILQKIKKEVYYFEEL